MVEEVDVVVLVGFGLDVEQPTDGVVVEQGEVAAGFEQACDDAGPTVEIVDPAHGPAPGVDQVGGTVQFVGRVEQVAAVPLGGGVEGGGDLAGVGDVHVGDVNADDAGHAFIPQREGVAARGALQVDGGFDLGQDGSQVGAFDRVQVALSGFQEGDGLIDSGGVHGGAFVPGGAIGFMPGAGFVLRLGHGFVAVDVVGGQVGHGFYSWGLRMARRVWRTRERKRAVCLSGLMWLCSSP